MRNFLYGIAGFSGSFTIEDRETKAVDYIKQAVGDKSVLVLVSGGVDSTVCAALIAKAIPPHQIFALHVDTGFMRLGESSRVRTALEAADLNLKVVDASNQFFDATTIFNGKPTKPLREITNPEEKRTIIGDQFMRVSQREIDQLGIDPDRVVLAQGTLRPDLIESGSKLASENAATIKTHHNDSPLVRKLREGGRVVEPLQEYHKDEVRALGSILGLPKEIVWRQPFPGPGLAVRIICTKEPYITDEFDQINKKLKQYSSEGLEVTLLPIQTVGVQGDGRTYSYLAGISGRKDWDELFRLALEIPKETRQINRLAYIFGGIVRGPITEITPTYLTEDSIKQLQQADDIVNTVLMKYDLIRKLSQVPVILFPVNFSIPGKRAIAIRTFITPAGDFYTGVPAKPGLDIPEEALEEMVSSVLSEVTNVSRVVYDLTSKPPGTTEWE